MVDLDPAFGEQLLDIAIRQVEALAAAGRSHDAEAVFGGLVRLGGELGLFAEQLQPTTRQQLGNTPQAFTHIGLINAGLRLADHTAKGSRGP